MYKLSALNKIAPCGLELFKKDKYEISENNKEPDVIMLRSFSLIDYELPSSLFAIARAGAGVNNIPVERCSEKGIVVFNTPGANANAVKELAIAGLFLASRGIIDGVNWARGLKGSEDVAKKVEKGKGAFAGNEIEGKCLAVIGLGAIGVMVANFAYYMGMEVIGYDPYISVRSALGLSRHVSVSENLEEALARADYVTIHAPLTDETRKMVDGDAINNMRDKVRLLNFSRADLVDEGALGAALESGKVSVYITDFPNERVLEMKNVIPIPHLGASTEESEENCAVMAARQLIDYVENGNITNSVNFPDCAAPRATDARLAIAHKNIPNMLGQLSSVIAKDGINIENMINKSKGAYAFTLADLCGATKETADKIAKIEGVLRVRFIR